MRVKLIKHLCTGLGWSAADVTLCREIDLPFPPFPWLEVSERDEFNAVIEHVAYDLTERAYVAFVEDDDSLARGDMFPRDANRLWHWMNRLVDKHMAYGWELDEPGLLTRPEPPDPDTTDATPEEDDA